MTHWVSGLKWVDASTNFCSRCVNFRDRNDGLGKGCPIDDIHTECDDPASLEEVFEKHLIGDEYAFPACAMFLDRSAASQAAPR